MFIQIKCKFKTLKTFIIMDMLISLMKSNFKIIFT